MVQGNLLWTATAALLLSSLCDSSLYSPATAFSTCVPVPLLSLHFSKTFCAEKMHVFPGTCTVKWSCYSFIFVRMTSFHPQ